MTNVIANDFNQVFFIRPAIKIQLSLEFALILFILFIWNAIDFAICRN